MFSHLPEPKLDPILSLSVAYRNDPRSEKVDLGIGVYKNSLGETPIMQAIGLAEHKVLDTQKTKSYVGLAGCEEFNQSMVSLVLGDSPVLDRVSAIQTPGASGALRMLGDLMKIAQPNTTVWLSNPSYVNHQPVMEAAGLKVKHYSYFCPVTKQVDTARMLEEISHAGKDDVVLLHGCCHNPTGADIDLETWQQLTQLAQDKGFTPFVDVAYQGFGDGIDEDAAGLRYMAERVEEMMITTSCSKNFGLYRERTGAAIVLGRSAKDALNARGKLLTMARATYTMPPDHGAALVKTILQDAELKNLWLQELTGMQKRLVSLREALCHEFRTVHNSANFDFIQSHKGMFTVLGFSQQQMSRLREEFGIYGVGDGRINIAGLTEGDISYVADAIYKVS
ncbi:aspartate/tyrosine/aromatic aminotransferase [Vibrio sp. 404]|uniref:Aspartate/tyrosine/aromatic aminotransferase n=1 Tax=Vibrio marinisediminis TaxID=2758441 RepID=A0A7W2FTF9_9VIBR|nr:amino acid aminotransferase [Vibrio marinisediminis]MBA5763953.1 aspartate/tyrosine/aromatic aminotransferase [Vibrio marinisediminis]